MYELIPVGTFLLGWLSAAVALRERLLRLTADRNLHAYRADQARVECTRAETERDELAAGAVRAIDGRNVIPLRVPDLHAAMAAHPSGKAKR